MTKLPYCATDCEFNSKGFAGCTNVKLESMADCLNYTAVCDGCGNSDEGCTGCRNHEVSR